MDFCELIRQLSSCSYQRDAEPPTAGVQDEKRICVHVEAFHRLFHETILLLERSQGWQSGQRFRKMRCYWSSRATNNVCAVICALRRKRRGKRN